MEDEKYTETARASPADEKQLVDYIRYQASKGEPVTTTWLLETAARLMKHR